MSRVRCTHPGCNFDTYVNGDPNKVLTSHRARWHGGQEFAEAVTQLDGVKFQEAYIGWVRSLPVGTEFTTSDAHGKIPDPPHANHWGSAQTAAAHAGLCAELGSQRSTLPTTRGSKLTRWVRVAAVQEAS